GESARRGRVQYPAGTQRRLGEKRLAGLGFKMACLIEADKGLGRTELLDERLGGIPEPRPRGCAVGRKSLRSQARFRCLRQLEASKARLGSKGFASDC